MRPISLLLPEEYLEALDQLVARKMYPNKAEAIRLAIRDLIISKKDVAGIKQLQKEA
jgi:Arc/MetJ-type ribon-helix-helix transcriptional regulator